MLRRRITIACISFALFLAAAAVAWEGALAGAVLPISEVLEKAESNDFVVVEGRVADVRSGNGSLVIVIFEDDSGSLPLVVPNHLQRHFAGGGPAGGSGPSGAEPKIGKRARVGGKWHHKPMDDGTWGIRVQDVQPLGD
jgi:hypothetical protein